MKIKRVNFDFSEAKTMFRRKFARQWGHNIARAQATLLIGRLHYFVVAFSSSGGRGTGQAASDVDKEAPFDHLYHFHSRNDRNA
jgi:hypothetical protein